MSVTGFGANLYQPLSMNEVKLIHKAAVNVLGGCGFMVENEECLKRFEEVGCDVDFENQIVRVSEELLMDYVKKAPSRVRLYGRETKHDVVIEPNKVVFQQGGTAVNIYDFETGERRTGKLADIAQAIKIADYLENLHIVEPPVTATELNDLEDGDKDINRLFTTVNNTTKPICMGVWEDPKHTIEMARMIAGGKEELREKPFIGFLSTCISPLKADKKNIDWVKQGIEAGIPIFWIGCPTLGLSAPMSLAGLLVQAVAECLFNVFFVQTIKAGAPTVFSVTPNAADMRTMQCLMGYTEMGVMSGALSQMASFYNLPLYSTGGLTESKTSDIQAGIEKSMMTLLATLSGGQYIHDVGGFLDSTFTYSLDQMIIDDVINGMALRVLRGIEVNKDSLADEVINTIGPGGHFLYHEHTMRHMRGEMYNSDLIERRIWSEWNDDGAKDMKERAHEKAMDILENHEPVRLPEEMVKAITEKYPAIKIIL
jgi:trimethylamine--corrinoid protein Co-methyltransferase